MEGRRRKCYVHFIVIALLASFKAGTGIQELRSRGDNFEPGYWKR
jgi:hypothetical protein